MLEFKTERLTERITRIFGFSTELMYLVEGDERAALLDTGSGFGSLKACVEQLTDKPLIVLLTHGHVDHAMGAAEFEEVYMSHKDEYIYQEHGEDGFRRKGILMELATEMCPEEYIKTAPFTHFKDVEGGDVFDLGGITIEIYDCHGHTKGSVVMLIREERAVLLGDACNDFTFMFGDYSTSIEEYGESLKRLGKQLFGKYDKVYLSHREGEGSLTMIADVLAVCEDIMNSNTDDVPFEFMNEHGIITKAMNEDMVRMDGKRGNIVYNKDKIWKD